MVQIPKRVTDLIKELHNAGFEAYIVGGAVRDFVPGEKPHDWDIASSADTDILQKIFSDRHFVPSGIQYGTVTVDGYELTTFRSESTYSDGRHPDAVTFAKTIEEDLKRRDFTINAMALDPTKPDRIIDPYDGQADLHDGLIRCVGDPKERFSEDALRMMRAIRFAAKFDFKIEEKTWRAIQDTSDLIRNVSAERICAELEKTLLSSHPKQGMNLLYDSGLMDQILPEVADLAGVINNFNPDEMLMKPSLFHETVDTLKSLKYEKVFGNEKCVFFAALCYNLGKPGVITKDCDGVTKFPGFAAKSTEIAENLLKRLKFSNDDLKYTLELIQYSDPEALLEVRGKGTPNQIAANIRRFAAEHTAKFGDSFLRDLLSLGVSISCATLYPSSRQMRAKQENGSFYVDFCKLCKEFVENGTAITMNQMTVNGNDVREHGFEGKEIGTVLSELYQKCLENPKLNDRGSLLEILENMQEKEKEEDLE